MAPGSCGDCSVFGGESAFTPAASPLLSKNMVFTPIPASTTSARPKIAASTRIAVSVFLGGCGYPYPGGICSGGRG